MDIGRLMDNILSQHEFIPY